MHSRFIKNRLYETLFAVKQEFYMTSLQDIIIDKLTRELSPDQLNVYNDSHKHAGHAGATNDSHFRIEIKASSLSNMTRVQAHQRIYAILDSEMKTRIHALQIIIL